VGHHHGHDDADAATHDGWQEVLRAKGHRLTPQREMVLRAVDRLGHATPDEVLQAVREESSALNISTVYRTLELLESLGLVRHSHLSDRAPTYHSTAGPQHAHLVCRSCGSVTEVTPDQLAPALQTIEAEQGFSVDVGHLAIFGLCRKCRDAPEETGTDTGEHTGAHPRHSRE